MTIAPSPCEIIRAIQDQQRATDRLVQILAAMLDRSAPDPFLSAAPLQQGEVRPAALPARPRRITDESARPPVVMMIDGRELKTTKRRAALLTAVMAAPLTLSAMSRQGIAPTVAGVKAQIIDTNRDLERAGIERRVRMQAQPAQRRGARGGREPALYALLHPKDHETVVPGRLPAAQDEAAAGERPEQEASASAVGDDAAIVAAQDAAFVAPAGGEVATLATESPSAADEAKAISPSNEIDSAPPPGAVEASPPAGIRRPPAAQPAAAFRQKVQLAPAKAAAARIEPGDLIAVDIKQKRIQTKRGTYEVGGANLARALDKLRGGHLFGLDVIAKVAGWPSPDVARTALGFERKRLADHGLDLFLDKFNVRLREAS